MSTSAAPVPEGRFTQEQLACVLARVCRRAGLDHRGATLLRFTNNAVFRLAVPPAVVRIVVGNRLRYRVPKVVRVAEWLAAHEFPAVRLWPGLTQPVRIGEYVATVWRWAPHVGSTPGPEDLARLLKRLHQLPDPPFALPRWAPLGDVRRRLGDAEDLPEQDRTFLAERCEDAQRRLDGLRFARGERRDGVVHGDAHLGNVIPAAEGPLLCDFDSTCRGPFEADLVPLPVGVLRFGGSDEELRRFTSAYGYDITRWHGFGVLREVRDLKLITSALPVARSNPAVREELYRRIADFRNGEQREPWCRYR